MREFINATGGKMLVDDSRVDEYLALGYKLTPISQKEESDEKPAKKKKKED